MNPVRIFTIAANKSINNTLPGGESQKPILSVANPVEDVIHTQARDSQSGKPLLGTAVKPAITPEIA